MIVHLALMLMLVLALQAQNHHNGGNPPHQGNNQPNYGNNDYHNQGNHNDHQDIRNFKGLLVRDNDGGPGNHQPGPGGNHPNQGGFGILIKDRGRDYDFHQLDSRGNQLVREMLRRRYNPRKRYSVQLTGYMDRQGTIHVRNVKKISATNQNFAGFNIRSGGHFGPGNNPGFQLFVSWP